MSVRFGKPSEFSVVLNKKVNEYFTANKVDRTGNYKIWLKTVILISAGVGLYFLQLLGNLTMPLFLLTSGMLGACIAFIGFNVMHDGAHGSYSNKPWINKLMSYTLDLLGGSSYFWNMKHNVNHHSFTNVEGHDDDIDIRPFIRASVHQKKYWFHRFQHIYWIFLYGLSYFSWIYLKDPKKYFTGKIAPDSPMKKMNTKQHIIFWLGKSWYVSAFIIIPIIVLGGEKFLLGHVTMSFVSGMILAIVFQLAHVVSSTSFPSYAPSPVFEDDWAKHQFATTANFATKNKVISWFVGGLNFQVEHHLFPRISHVHYPMISPIVKQVCADFNVPYNEYKTFGSAVASHVRYLKEVGNAPESFTKTAVA